MGGAATGYLYDGANPVQELTGTTPSANILTGLGVDEFYRRTDTSGSRDMLTDALGSIILKKAVGIVARALKMLEMEDFFR